MVSVWLFPLEGTIGGVSFRQQQQQHPLNLGAFHGFIESRLEAFLAHIHIYLTSLDKQCCLDILTEVRAANIRAPQSLFAASNMQAISETRASSSYRRQLT